MKRILSTIALIFTLGTWIDVSANFSYPFWEIAKPSCRKEAWSTLQADCKMPLPKISGADYMKYKNDSSFRRIYTVLWGATYDYGWDVGLGSHLGVDIATSEGTPVLAIGAGKVIQAGKASGWGNFITIAHTLVDKTTLFSNYAHLSEIQVKVGDIVQQGQVIGNVGNTGNSYGNHLHFQIDITDQLHPYYYSKCGAGKNPIDLVNKGECRSFLLSNTIDPIAFLENGTLSTSAPTAETIETIKQKPSIIIEKKSIKSREEILNEEAEEYLKSYNVLVGLPAKGMTTLVGRPLDITIRAEDFNKNPSIKNLPGAGLKIVVDESKGVMSASNITQLFWGKRTIQFIPKSPGVTPIRFVLWKREIAKGVISVLPKGQSVTTNQVEIRATAKPYLGQEYDAYIAPLSAYGSYIGNLPYRERYILEVVKGKAKFCLKLPPKGSPCDPSLLVESLEFWSADTALGYLSTRIVALGGAPIEVSVRQKNAKNSLARTKLTVQNPTNLDRRYLYYDAVIAGLGKNWWSTRSGYAGQEQQMTTPMVREMVERLLAYRMLKAGNDIQKKQAARSALDTFRRTSSSLPNKNWSRGEFAELLLRTLKIPLVQRSPVFQDEAGAFEKTIWTLRSVYSFRWQDQFGERYFQGSANITVGEALYLLERVYR